MHRYQRPLYSRLALACVLLASPNQIWLIWAMCSDAERLILAPVVHWNCLMSPSICVAAHQTNVCSDAERLILAPVVNCSLRAPCIAPPGSSRLDHNFDQTAFTLAIWANNYTCLPRETHCMWRCVCVCVVFLCCGCLMEVSRPRKSLSQASNLFGTCCQVFRDVALSAGRHT